LRNFGALVVGAVVGAGVGALEGAEGVEVGDKVGLLLAIPEGTKAENQT